jgi:hypothetical protein
MASRISKPDPIVIRFIQNELTSSNAMGLLTDGFNLWRGLCGAAITVICLWLWSCVVLSEVFKAISQVGIILSGLYITTWRTIRSDKKTTAAKLAEWNE